MQTILMDVAENRFVNWEFEIQFKKINSIIAKVSKGLLEEKRKDWGVASKLRYTSVKISSTMNNLFTTSLAISILLLYFHFICNHVALCSTRKVSEKAGRHASQNVLQKNAQNFAMFSISINLRKEKMCISFVK